MSYFRYINGNEPPAQVNKILEEMNDHARGVNVFTKEVAFESDFSRFSYCKNLHDLGVNNHNPWEFGTSVEMLRATNRTHGTLYLVACRETKANCHTNAALRNPGNIDQISIDNRANQLDWHNAAIFYKNRVLYYFEPRLDMSIDEFRRRTVQFKFRARLVDFIKNNVGLPIDRIFVGGDGLCGNCRAKSLEFIKNIVISQVNGQRCGVYTFYEFVIGPREPSVNRYLATLNYIPA